MIMAGPVSMWGPNAQGVRSRPDRSVSLQPELLRAEQMRPQQMGGVFHWGGYGNPPALWQSGPDGRGFWGGASDLEGRKFLEAAAEQARREGKDVPPDPEGGSAEEGNWVTKIYDYLGRTPRYISLPDEGGITDDVPEPADSDAVEPVPDPVPEPLPEPDDGPWLFQGLPPAYDMGGTFPMSSERPTVPMGPDRPQPSRPTLQLGPDRPRPVGSETETGRALQGFLRGIGEALPDAVAEDPEFSATQLRDLVSRMGGEPPRIGRQNPESSRDGRERGGDFLPGAPLSDEQRRINQRGLEGARDVLRGLGGSVGDMPLEHKLALVAAMVGAGLLTVGTGGLAGPALMAGGGLSLLSNQ